MFFSWGGGREKRVSENSARFGAIRQYAGTREYSMSTGGGGGGGRSDSRGPLVVRERAVARSRVATGAVTMTTRYSTVFRSYVTRDV